MINDKINVQGKYAMQHIEMLENHAPDIYNAMLENGSLEEPLRPYRIWRKNTLTITLTAIRAPTNI